MVDILKIKIMRLQFFSENILDMKIMKIEFENLKISNILYLYSESLELTNEFLNHCVNYTSNRKQCDTKI